MVLAALVIAVWAATALGCVLTFGVNPPNRAYVPVLPIAMVVVSVAPGRSGILRRC